MLAEMVKSRIPLRKEELLIFFLTTDLLLLTTDLLRSITPSALFFISLSTTHRLF